MKYALVLNAPSLDVEIEEQLIIAADGGYRLVKDKPVQAVIGDFDTLGYLPNDVKTITHPTDKDKTDGEICLDYVKSIGGSAVTLYGGTGGHVDHVLGNVNLLAYGEGLGLKMRMVDKESVVYFINSCLIASCSVGDVISVLPYGGECTFSYSKGLKYSLDGLTIKPYSSLGLSNKVTEGMVEIKVKNGSALVIIRKKS